MRRNQPRILISALYEPDDPDTFDETDEITTVPRQAHPRLVRRATTGAPFDPRTRASLPAPLRNKAPPAPLPFVGKARSIGDDDVTIRLSLYRGR